MEAIRNYECGIAINGIQINPDLPNPNPEILNIKQKNLGQYQQQNQQQMEGQTTSVKTNTSDNIGSLQTQDSLIKEKYFRSSLSPDFNGVNDNISNMSVKQVQNSQSDQNVINNDENDADSKKKKGSKKKKKKGSKQESNEIKIGTQSSPSLQPFRSNRSQSVQETNQSVLIPSIMRNSSISVAKEKDSNTPHKEKGFNAFSKLNSFLFFSRLTVVLLYFYCFWIEMTHTLHFVYKTKNYSKKF